MIDSTGVENPQGDCHTYSMRLGDFEITEPLPQLKDPHVLAALYPWIDIGNVGTLGLARIERHLRATELGRLARPGRFYDFTRYRPRTLRNRGVREFTIPNTIIRYAIREEGPDLVLMHMMEPHSYGEDYVGSVLEVLKTLNVTRYSLVGGMYDMVPHTRPLLVTGGAQKPDDEEYPMVRTKPSKYEGPTSITYLISQEAERIGIDTRTYVVHLPQYFQVEEDFTGTARLMEILCHLYQLPDRLIDRQRGTQQYEALQHIVKDTTEVSSLLNRLEERYDREQREDGVEATDPSPLSADIENFLREINEGFDAPEDQPGGR